MSVSLQIWDKIKAFNQGNVFCANDFDDIGTRGNIDVILHRLWGYGSSGTVNALKELYF